MIEKIDGILKLGFDLGIVHCKKMIKDLGERNACRLISDTANKELFKFVEKEQKERKNEI